MLFTISTCGRRLEVSTQEMESSTYQPPLCNATTVVIISRWGASYHYYELAYLKPHSPFTLFTTLLFSTIEKTIFSTSRNDRRRMTAADCTVPLVALFYCPNMDAVSLKKRLLNKTTEEVHRWASPDAAIEPSRRSGVSCFFLFSRYKSLQKQGSLQLATRLVSHHSTIRKHL